MLLIRHGLVVDAENGVAVSNDPAIEPLILALVMVAYQSMIRLAEDLHPDMAFGSPDHVPVSDLPLRIMTTGIDLWLVPHEYAAEPVADWTSKLVWIVIVVANVRHITTDPALSERYAVAPTPDDLRRPITVRQIGRITGLSYGTVYRHCQSLAEKDVIEYDRGGWLLVSRQLKHRSVDQGVKALLAYFRKRIEELVSFGFDPAVADRFYINGRHQYDLLN